MIIQAQGCDFMKSSFIEESHYQTETLKSVFLLTVVIQLPSLYAIVIYGEYYKAIYLFGSLLCFVAYKLSQSQQHQLLSTIITVITCELVFALMLYFNGLHGSITAMWGLVFPSLIYLLHPTISRAVLIINASLLLVLYLLVNQGYLLEYYGNKLDTLATIMQFIGLIAVTLWSLQRNQVLVEMSQQATEQAFQAEKALNQRKDEFLSNMSHELRTPLNGIYGVLQLIDGKDEEEASLIQSAKAATHSLTRIVNDILDTQKMALGKLDLHLEWTHIRDAASKLETLFTTATRQKNIQFIVCVHDDVPIEVYVDKARIGQILSNLIGNAIKFTDYGSVSMTLSFQRQSLTIEISDTGIGMGEAFQNKMFERFTQEDTSHSKPYQGTGLGLSICKQLVELMNGTIHIKSQLEQGTSIGITLPVESRGVYQCEKQAVKLINSTPNPLSQAHILLVDDDDINLTVAKTMLDQYCNVVRTASDAQQALTLAQSGKFDVLITDIQMPKMDGVTLLKAIQDTHTDLPCIALTANASKQDISDYYNQGFVGVVTKPFERAVLLDVLTQVIQAKETKPTRV